MSEPKLIVTEIFNRYQEFTQQIFKDFAEPNAFMITVDWKIGSNDFPAGTLIARESISAEMVISLISQMNKQEKRLVQTIIDRMIQLEEKMANDADKRITRIATS